MLSGGLAEFLDCFGNWFFIWVLATLADVMQDVNLWSSYLYTLKGLDHKELGGKKGGVRVVSFASTMVSSSQEHIWFTH